MSVLYTSEPALWPPKPLSAFRSSGKFSRTVRSQHERTYAETKAVSSFVESGKWHRSVSGEKASMPISPGGTPYLKQKTGCLQNCVCSGARRVFAFICGTIINMLYTDKHNNNTTSESPFTPMQAHKRAQRHGDLHVIGTIGTISPSSNIVFRKTKDEIRVDAYLHGPDVPAATVRSHLL